MPPLKENDMKNFKVKNINKNFKSKVMKDRKAQ